MKTSRSFLKMRWLLLAAAWFGVAGPSAAQQYLYTQPGPVGRVWRDNYTGASGCLFTVGSSNVVVSHLGYYTTNTATGLATPHPVGIYDSGVRLLGQVTVPIGKGGYSLNNFYWAQLDPPLLLKSNTAYYVAGMPASSDGDWWVDSYTPSSWNAYFVGSQGTATRQSAYAPSGSAWPATSFTTVGNNTTYLLEGLANLAQGPARAGVETNLLVATAFGQDLSLAGFASGAPTITYLWYKDGSPLATQTTSTLTLNSVSSFDNGTYFLTATNSLGGEQSVNVTVAVGPVILVQSPQVTASPILLYSGANPTFSLSVAGIPPISYQWMTNGVPVDNATNASYTLTNAQASGPTQIACFVANVANSIMSPEWDLSFVARPTAPYQAAVLADQPIGYWPLNEAEQGLGDNGVPANEYLGARNGVYTNTSLAQSGYAQGLAARYGYTPATDSETSARFGSVANPNSDANSIYGVDFSAASGSSVTFSVEAWVKGTGPTAANAGIASKGYFNYEEFALDTGASNNCYRLSIRSANGTRYDASSTTNSGDGLWHHLVGVCDQSNSVVKLYIDGVVAGSVSIAPGSGLMAANASAPMSIGARAHDALSGANNQFSGYINDVALYSNALSSNQVVAHYVAAGIGAHLAVQPPASTNVNEGSTLQVPTQSIGTPALSYRWYDTTSGSPGTPVPNQTNATLVISNISATTYNGHSFALTVTNAYGRATSSTIAVTVTPGPPSSVAIMPSSLTLYAGLPVFFTASGQGSQPFFYHWTLDGSPVAGATNSTYTNAATAGAHTVACYVTNSHGLGTPYPATASLTGVTHPTDNYSTHILNDSPLAYWRLGEPANASVVYDYVGSHNGSYTNAVNAQPGPSPQDPDTATAFGTNGVTSNSLALENDKSASGIPNLDFSTQGANARFSLEAWVKAPPNQKTGARLLGKGYGSGGEQFCLDVYTGGHFRFFIRTAGNTFVRTAQSTNAGPDGNWHYVAAVCDQAGGQLSLYVDGALNATGTTVAGEGLQGPLPAVGPVLTGIGSGMSSSTDVNYSLQLSNALMAEVAVYNYALSSNQVAAHYLAVGVPPRIVTGLDSFYDWYASVPFDLSVVVSGSPPLSYQWQKNAVNLSDTAILSGTRTNTLLIDPTAVTDSGSYRVIVTNSSGAATSTVALVTMYSRLALIDYGDGWSANGQAQYPFSDYLQLTDGGAGRPASSFFSAPVYVGGFEASFTYQDIGGGGADGMAFVIQNDPRGATALGGGGGALGYSGITNSVAVEFNIYNPNVVGFAFQTNGVTGGPYNSTAPVNLASGDPIDVSLTYLNGVLTLTLDDATAQTSFTTSLGLDIPGTVGANAAYVGFTGADGGTSSKQWVSGFTYLGLVGLGIQTAASQHVIVSWPASAGGYVLQQSAALNPAHWTNVVASPVNAGQVEQVTLPASASHAVLRLINNP